jgi:serine/threonine protein kinase
LPPEQATDKGHCRRASDVYSLGAVLISIADRAPAVHWRNASDTLLKSSKAQTVAPRLLNPSTPRDLEIICLKCLEKSPQRRYLSAQELADDTRSVPPPRADPHASRQASGEKFSTGAGVGGTRGNLGASGCRDCGFRDLSRFPIPPGPRRAMERLRDRCEPGEQ